MRRLVAVAAAALLLGGGCAAHGGDHADGAGHAGHEGHGEEATSTTSDGPAAGATPWISDTDDDALFTVDCTFSHRAPDDPIVHPDQPGASHSHEFFGSAATDASSTGESLQGTATTCQDPEDTAAYWVPTLSVDGVPVDPTFLRAYYRARPGVDVRDVVAPPLGLAMIAGDPDRGGGHDHGTATEGTADDEGAGDDTGSTTTTESAAHDHGSAAHDHSDEAEHDHGSDATDPAPTTTVVPDADDPTAEAGWGCGLRPLQLHVDPPTDCTDISPLTLRLRFPDCWDGESLDSADHRSHVARSVDGECPDTHPVVMTELQLSIQWPVTGEDAAAVTIDSGSTAGAHGDFLNGWDPDALARHVDLCIHAEVNCTIG